MAKRAEARYILTAEDRTGRGVSSAMASIGQLKSSLLGFKAAAVAMGASAVGAIAGIVKPISDTANKLDELAKTGKEFELSPSATRAFQFAADQAGVSAERFFRTFERVQREIAKARRGEGEAADMFASIGMEPEQLNQMSRIERFVAVLTTLSRLRRSGVNIAQAQEQILGEGAGRLVAQGPQALVQSLQIAVQSTSAGLDEMAANAETAKDAQAELSMAVGTFAEHLTGQGIPALEMATQSLTSFFERLNMITGAVNVNEEQWLRNRDRRFGWADEQD